MVLAEEVGVGGAGLVPNQQCPGWCRISGLTRECGVQDGGSAFHTVLEVFESNFGSAVACASHDPEPYGCPHTNAVIRDLAVRALRC